MKFRICILLFILLLTGCRNYNELEDLSICTAMGIDLENNKYKVTYMIANSKKSDVSAKEGEAQTILYNGTGNSISEAINEIYLVSPKVIYIGHLSVLVISEDVARDGVSNVLDYLLRTQESRKKFNIVLTQNSKAEDVLKILSPLETFPSGNIISNLNSSEQIQSLSNLDDFNWFIGTLMEEGVDPHLSSISVIGNVKEGSELKSLEKTTADTYLKVNTIGLFKEDKLVDFANIDETLGTNFILNKVSRTLINIPCNDSYINLDVDKSKTKINIKYDQEPFINIDISLEASIDEINCKIDLEKTENINDLEKQGKEKVEELVENSILLAKKNKSDIYGFGKMIHKEFPKKWKNIKDKWDDEMFDKLKYNLKVDFKIIGTGSLKNTLKVKNEKNN